MNVGDYVTAREHLEKLSKQNPKTDYVAYGLAALDCLTGHVEDSLRTWARRSASIPRCASRRATIPTFRTSPRIRALPSCSIPIQQRMCPPPEEVPLICS